MALEGTLKDFGLADILQLIGIQRKTGVLTVENDDDSVVVKFLEGQVVGADTRKRNLEDLLGAVLVRTGRITQAQLEESLRIQRGTLQRLGYILVKSGFVSEGELQEALRVQVTQIVYRLFRWRTGRYHFAPSDHVEYDQEHFVPVRAETILMEGARMVDEWPIIERRIRSGSIVLRKTAASAALETPVRSIVDADIDLGFQPDVGAGGADGEIRLSQDAREVLRLVDGRSTVQDIAERCPLGEFDSYRLLYELLNRNLVEEVRTTLGIEPIAPAGVRQSLAQGGLSVLVGAIAIFAVITLHLNPLSPWAIEGRGETTDRLRTFASRARIERLEQAIRAFYLDCGAVPGDLDVLARTGFLQPKDLLDPWSHPYRLAVGADGYRIEGLDHDGGSRDDLELRHRFTTAERLVLEGAAVSQPTSPRP